MKRIVLAGILSLLALPVLAEKLPGQHVLKQN